MGSFMQPDVYEGRYVEIDGTHGITALPIEVIGSLPADAEARADAVRDFYSGEIWTVEEKTGILGRLSAPGYMDCTDWSPYDSVAEALADLREQNGDDEEDDEEEAS